MTLVLAFFALLSIGSCHGDRAFSELESQSEDTFENIEAIAFVEAQGIETYGEIFYHKRSENVTACLQRPDAKNKVLQMCAARALVDQCVEVGVSFYFSHCHGQSCTAHFSKEESFCLLERSGLLGELNATDERQLCSLSKDHHSIFQWQLPSYVSAIGDENHFDCLTALPAMTILERCVICEDGHPILHHRVTFDSMRFLKTDVRNVECVATQVCGLPTIFAGEVACYEVGLSSSDQDASHFVIADAPEMQPESLDDESNAMTARISGGRKTVMILLLISFWISFFP